MDCNNPDSVVRCSLEEGMMGSVSETDCSEGSVIIIYLGISSII